MSRPPQRILNVAEKPSVAKAIAHILSEGHAQTRQGQSRYNPIYEFPYTYQGREVMMLVTSVAGHIHENDFDGKYSSWTSVDPGVLFFEAPVKTAVSKQFEPLAVQLRSLSRTCQLLILWLDCDREGEAIGYEVLAVCQEGNAQIDVLRAHFSALIPRDIHNAMRTLTPPNPHLRDAVEARQEIDLRIGAAFTRFQSMRLQKRFSGHEAFSAVLSYGPCQFPTLGFVCERELKRRRFQAEAFWTIEMELIQQETIAKFNWQRHRLFDRHACVILFEEMVEEGSAVITDVTSRQTSKYRPCPLATVEMQKRLSRAPIRLSSHRSMEIAESLYQRGYISYPRTETDSFKEGTDLQNLIRIQSSDPHWGGYAQGLLAEGGGFAPPKNGGHDDGAHPPIHPTKPPDGITQPEELRVYEFITRHFLACCSKDAIGHQTTVVASIGLERFTSTGLMVTERNFLDVYPYEKWVDHPMPFFQRDQRFLPTKLMMREGQTEPPPLLSESDLISLMDKNGIGTDATIAQHIKTILDRGYVTCNNHLFSPTPLGLGLVEGYDALDFQMSQPTLRAHMERELVLISRGLKSKQVVIDETLQEMKRVFDVVGQRASVLEEHLEKYFPAAEAQRSLQTLALHFSKCGQCGQMCDLKQSGGQFPQKLLFCRTCSKSLGVPSKGQLQPHEHICPICQYQVLTVINEEKQTSHTVCPYCFNNPPAADIEDTGQQFSGGFRCFQCTKADCALSNKSRGRASNEPVRACDVCGQMMTLKTWQSGVIYLGCNGYPQCTNKLSFSAAKDVQLTAEECPTCIGAGGFKSRLLSFNFNPGSAPPHIANPLIACVGCDPDVRELFGTLARRNPSAPPPSAHAVVNRPPPPRSSRPPPPVAPTSVPPPDSSYRPNTFPSSSSSSGGLLNGPHGLYQPGNRSPSPAESDSRKRRGSSVAASAGGARGKRGRVGRGGGSRVGRGISTAAAFNRQSDDDDDADEKDEYGHPKGASFVEVYRQQQQQQARAAAAASTAPTNTWNAPPPSPAINSYNPAATSTASNLPSWNWQANANAKVSAPSSASSYSSSGGRDLSGVDCFKCHQKGHYANSCPGVGGSNSSAAGRNYSSRVPPTTTSSYGSSSMAPRSFPGAAAASAPRSNFCSECGKPRPTPTAKFCPFDATPY